MKVSEFIAKVKTEPNKVSFEETISVIDANYQFTPTVFSNGNQINDVNENNGSCKIFAFAKLNQLNKLQTLTCFGNYYFEEVVLHPEGIDHQNIRNFMKFGWDGIHFNKEALSDLK